MSQDAPGRGLVTAVIGCGYWGPTLARAAARTGYFDLRAAVDLDEAAAIEVKQSLGMSWSSTVTSDVWGDEEIEAVLIATDAASHFALASDALRAGKHALVEKPLALTVSDCAELAALAMSADRTLMVGHTFMYSPLVAAVKKEIDSGAIGTLHYMHLRRLAFGRFRRDVNVTWNLGPHDVSILNYWAGTAPLAVRCAEHYCSRPSVADVATITIDYGSFFGHAHLSCADPDKVRAATIAGSAGGLVYDDVAKRVRLIRRVGAERQAVDLRVKDSMPLDAECGHFARCVITGSSPRTGASHAVEVVAVLEAATKSASRDGAWVAIDHHDLGRAAKASSAAADQAGAA